MKERETKEIKMMRQGYVRSRNNRRQGEMEEAMRGGESRRIMCVEKRNFRHK